MGFIDLDTGGDRILVISLIANKPSLYSNNTIKDLESLEFSLPYCLHYV